MFSEEKILVITRFLSFSVNKTALLVNFGWFCFTVVDRKTALKTSEGRTQSSFSRLKEKQSWIWGQMNGKSSSYSHSSCVKAHSYVISKYVHTAWEKVPPPWLIYHQTSFIPVTSSVSKTFLFSVSIQLRFHSIHRCDTNLSRLMQPLLLFLSAVIQAAADSLNRCSTLLQINRLWMSLLMCALAAVHPLCSAHPMCKFLLMWPDLQRARSSFQEFCLLHTTLYSALPYQENTLHGGGLQRSRTTLRKSKCGQRRFWQFSMK